MKGRIIILMAVFAMIAFASLAFAQTPPDQGPSPTSTVCCEKTTSGLYCQDVPAGECAVNSRQTPTACASTSFCRQGTCYDSKEGTCLDKTPELVCTVNNGTWSQNSPAQCGLGCCVLGDQAAFVSLVRCKRLSASLGLKTNYRSDITDETQCVLSVKNREKGACVYESEFEKSCKFITRQECAAGVEGSKGAGEFFAGKLCSAEELATVCGPTQKTSCLPGKDEVYFVDSCGNPANIYDASKINDKEYWNKVILKDNSCQLSSNNGNAKSCGNCNYLQGSFCRDSSVVGVKADYGEAICANLNCKSTQNGKSYKHGESWCVYEDKGGKDNGVSGVGSRYYKHVCINGEEVLEQCADFRQEVCIEDSISTTQGKFSQAACRVNRWQDCVAQIEEVDCKNSDRRDCIWKVDNYNANGVVCLPNSPPGLKFWEDGEAKEICAQANAQCIVKFEKGLFGGEECKSNCECLTESWTKQRADICSALGDCGPKVNWQNVAGNKQGYKVVIGDAPKEEKK